MTDTNPQQAEPLAAAREQEIRDIVQQLRGWGGAPSTWTRMLHDVLAEVDRLRTASAPVSPAPADRAAILREAADAIEEAQHLRDDTVNEALGFLDNNTEQQHKAVHRSSALLRRMADAASGPGGVAGETQPEPAFAPGMPCEHGCRAAADELTRETQQDEMQADLLPAWEAMYEPGNVSDYLIGYANDEAPAKAAAEAWLRSESEVTGRLEWVAEERLAVDEYDRWFELIERHDDGIDTGPGITVRRRVEPAAVSQPDGEA